MQISRQDMISEERDYSERRERVVVMSSCHRWKDEVFLLLLFVLTLKTTFISSKSEVYATSVPSSVVAPPNNGSWVLIFEVSRRSDFYF